MSKSQDEIIAELRQLAAPDIIAVKKERKKEQTSAEEFLEILYATIAILSVLSFTLGFCRGFFWGDCGYKSIASRVNIAYVVSCEFFKPRFNE